MSHLTQHIKSWWTQRRYGMPRWENDPAAQMLGAAQYGCPSCGHGAIDERDEEAA